MSKDTSLGNRKQSKGLPLGLLFSIIGLLALAGGAFMVFRDTTPPAITIGPNMEHIGKQSQLMVMAKDPGSGLASLEVVAVQAGKRIPLLSETFAGAARNIEKPVTLDGKQIKEGELTIEVTARDASLYPFGDAGLAKAQKTYVLDTTPPRIYVQSHTNNLNRGGCGFLVFSLSEKASVAGIQVGERFFPAHLQPGGNDKFLYYCLFAHPWDVKAADFKPMITAADASGNSATRSSTTTPTPGSSGTIGSTCPTPSSSGPSPSSRGWCPTRAPFWTSTCTSTGKCASKTGRNWWNSAARPARSCSGTAPLSGCQTPLTAPGSATPATTCTKAKKSIFRPISAWIWPA